MMDLAALMLAVAGFAALALSMHKHHRDVFGSPPTHRRASAFRAIRWALLGLSFGACVFNSGWAIGPVLWLGLLSVSGLTVTLLLSVQRSAARASGIACFTTFPAFLD
jgi:hypothetical protein